jgi:hypothetical protein
MCRCDDLTLMYYIGPDNMMKSSHPPPTVDSQKVKAFCEKMCLQYDALDTPYGKEMMETCNQNKSFELGTTLFKE